MIETVLMSMLYGGQVNTMMPKLHSTNFEGMELLRPLYFVKERAIIDWKEENGLHFLQCACRFTEASQRNGPCEPKCRVRRDGRRRYRSLLEASGDEGTD